MERVEVLVFFWELVVGWEADVVVCLVDVLLLLEVVLVLLEEVLVLLEVVVGWVVVAWLVVAWLVVDWLAGNGFRCSEQCCRPSTTRS